MNYEDFIDTFLNDIKNGRLVQNKYDESHYFEKNKYLCLSNLDISMTEEKKEDIDDEIVLDDFKKTYKEFPDDSIMDFKDKRKQVLSLVEIKLLYKNETLLVCEFYKLKFKEGNIFEILLPCETNEEGHFEDLDTKNFLTDFKTKEVIREVFKYYLDHSKIEKSTCPRPYYFQNFQKYFANLKGKFSSV